MLPSTHFPIYLNIVNNHLHSKLRYSDLMNKMFADYLKETERFNDTYECHIIVDEFRWACAEDLSCGYELTEILKFPDICKKIIDIYKLFYIRAVDYKLDSNELNNFRMAYMNVRKRLDGVCDE